MIFLAVFESLQKLFEVWLEDVIPLWKLVVVVLGGENLRARADGDVDPIRNERHAEAFDFLRCDPKVLLIVIILLINQTVDIAMCNVPKDLRVIAVWQGCARSVDVRILWLWLGGSRLHEVGVVHAGYVHLL